MFPHLYNASVPVTTILSALTARGGHLAFLVEGGEPLGFQGVFFGFDGWTLVPFALGLAFVAKGVLENLRTRGLRGTAELAKDLVGEAEKAKKKISAQITSCMPTVCYPSIFICGAADRSGRGKRCSSCCCCGRGPFFQFHMYTFLGREKAKSLSREQKGCEKAKTLFQEGCEKAKSVFIMVH